jgi:hypothetical protein
MGQKIVTLVIHLFSIQATHTYGMTHVHDLQSQLLTYNTSKGAVKEIS